MYLSDDEGFRRSHSRYGDQTHRRSVKSFSLIVGIVLTGLCQWVIDGQPLALKDFAAFAFVSIAIFLHSKHPAVKSELNVQNSKTAARNPFHKKD